MFEAQLSDTQFYLKKINRLETDLASTQQELMTARLRLRTAQDYEIKYELLLKQSHQQNSRLRIYEREEQERIAEVMTIKMKERDCYWNEQMDWLQRQMIEKYEKQVESLNEELEKQRIRTEQNVNKKEQLEILTIKNKKLQKDIDTLEQKMYFMQKDHEKHRQQEIRQLKQSLITKNKDQQQNQRTIYQSKIQTLETAVSELQRNLIEAKAKADPERQSKIDLIKNQLIAQNGKSNQELQKLRTVYEQKNEEIENLVEERLKAEQNLIEQKRQLKEYIKTLQDQIYEKERHHEIELIHLKQRMSKIREQETEELNNQIKRMSDNFQVQRSSWDMLIVDKDKQIQTINNRFNEQTQKQKEDKGRLLKKMEQLKNRLKEYEGEREAGDTEHLLKSLRDLEGRESEFSSYQNGVTFLDRQLKKAISRIEQKNIESAKLLKQLNDLRDQYEEEVNDLKEKSRKEKKYFIDRISALEEQIKNLNELIRKKDKDHRKTYKDLENKITQKNKQNTSLKELVQQVQKDYLRAIQNKKSLQSSYREQRSRGLTSKSDLTIVKKQKWLEIEKQKNDLQAIFKEKEQQLKNKHQIEVDRLRKQRNELKKQNQELKGQNQVYKQNNDQDISNQENLYSDYHKKMATLNLEIALTKNIYDSLISAKSRKLQFGKTNSFDRISQGLSNNDEDNEPLPNTDAHVTQRQSELQGLTMSFNPKLM